MSAGAAAVAGGAFGAISSFSSASAQEDALEGQAEAAQLAAEERRRQAEEVRQRTEIAVAAAEREAFRIKGTAQAVGAASGISISSGTPIDVFADLAGELAEGIEIVQFEGESAALALEESAELLEKTGRDLENQAGSVNPFLSGLTGFAGGFLSSGGFGVLDTILAPATSPATTTQPFGAPVSGSTLLTPGTLI